MISHLPPTQLIVGPPQHGVVRYATRIADAVALAHPSVPIVSAATVDELIHRLGSGVVPDRAHLHVTDRLLGATAIEAAESVERLATLTSVSVTLHDLPQPSDNAGFARRVVGYRRIIAAAAAVACNSRHEVRLIHEHLGLDGTAIAAIPLPVATVPPHDSDRGAASTDIAVLGFIYPGKGHAEVIDVVAAMHPDARVRVIALGAPSPGHESNAEALRLTAQSLDVDFEITGFLDDAHQLARCRAVAVPVVALQHVSASGSIATWIEAGRRPLVPDSRYAREIDALRPGTVTLYDHASLAEAVRTALSTPETTWLQPGIDTRPHLADTADAYLHWWGMVTW